MISYLINFYVTLHNPKIINCKTADGIKSQIKSNWIIGIHRLCNIHLLITLSIYSVLKCRAFKFQSFSFQLHSNVNKVIILLDKLGKEIFAQWFFLSFLFKIVQRSDWQWFLTIWIYYILWMFFFFFWQSSTLCFYHYFCFRVFFVWKMKGNNARRRTTKFTSDV
jgi:hypothetical protein